MEKFSVLMSVYIKENPEYLRQSLSSIYNQTVRPDEVVVVEDGPLTEALYIVLDEFEQTERTLIRVRNETNLGLGRALQRGLEFCSYELVARQDSDDICVPNRFEKQLLAMENDKRLSIVGGNIAEFAETPEKIISYRCVPKQHDEICIYMKKRCPMNHVTVMFRKSAVLKAGGYRDWYWDEDYYLWIRMYLSGAIFANLDDILVNVRVGKEMYARRGGRRYYKSERELFKFMKQNNVITGWEYLQAKTVRYIVQVMMTNRMRQWFFKRFARKN